MSMYVYCGFEIYLLIYFYVVVLYGCLYNYDVGFDVVVKICLCGIIDMLMQSQIFRLCDMFFFDNVGDVCCVLVCYVENIIDDNCGKQGFFVNVS